MNEWSNESRLARGVLGALPLISEFGGHPNSVLAATLHIALKGPAGKKRAGRSSDDDFNRYPSLRSVDLKASLY